MTLLEIKLLMIIIFANAAPILANHLARGRAARPIDAGKTLPDGLPLFGRSKTWRGLTASLLLSLLVGILLDVPYTLALAMGALAMAGDLLSSFLKRRLRLAPSDRALLLDQIPESLLPALLAQQWLSLPPVSVAWLVILFVLFELVFSPIAYWLRIRKRPY